MYIPRKGIIPIKALEFADCKVEFDAKIANQVSNFPSESMSCHSDAWNKLFPKDWEDSLCSIEQDKEFLTSLKLLICERNTKFFQKLDKTRKSYLEQLKDLSEEDRDILIKAFIFDLITIDSEKYTILNCSCKKCPVKKKR